MTKEMRAAYIEQYGGPEQIQVGRRPVPKVGPTDILLRVLAAPVNHIDTIIRAGRYRTSTPFPFTVGRDAVGEVVEVGAGVNSIRVGDLAWTNSLGYQGRQGSFSEFALVPQERIFPVPAGVDPVQVVALAHAASTAFLGLSELRAGATVLIGGAGGAVGSAAVQLAVAAGAKVVATCSPVDFDWVRSLGAGAVYDYHQPALADSLRRDWGDACQLYWDTSGHHNLAAAFELMAPGGEVLIAAGLEAAAELPIGPFYLRGLRLRGFTMSGAGVDDLARAATRTNQLLTEGHLRARIGCRLDLSEAATAHRLLAAGTVRGKILVEP